MSTPVASVDVDGMVTLRVAPEDAQVLAELLARWHALMTVTADTLAPQIHDDPADPAAPALAFYGVAGWDPHTWLTATTQLIVARNRADTSLIHGLHLVPAVTSVRELQAPGGGA